MKKFIPLNTFKKYLNLKEYQTIKECSEIAFICGFKLYLIGGIVRDLLLNKKSVDIDITVEGSAHDFVKILQKKLHLKSVKYNKNLPTAKVRFKNNTEIDFASTRNEEYPIQGELPVIKQIGTSLKEDVLRRDFTINSIALSLNKENFLELIDYTGGTSDLYKKQIKVLHDKSFYDDPSRIIRGLKFAERYGFKLEKHTLNLQNNYLEKPLQNIPLKRVRDEIEETFGTVRYSPYNEFIKQKLYKIFFPELMEKISGKSIHDLIFDFNINEKDIPLLYFLPLFFGQKIPEKLNLTSREIAIINNVNKFIDKAPAFSSDTDIKYFFDKQDYLVCVFFGLIHNHEISQKYFSKLSKIKLLINGNDLKKLGIPEGNIYKNIMKKVLSEKIEKGLNTKEEEINYIKSIL